MRIRTKEINFKPLEITLLSILFLGLVTLIKYKPVYNVTVSGKTLGYVSEKYELENNLNDYINHREGTIALITIANMPEYSLELVDRKTNTSEQKIFEKIKDTAVITYKTYAITLNGEKIDEVNTEIEAESIISTLQSDLIEEIEFNLGIVEVFKTEQTAVSKDIVFDKLNGMKLAKVEEYEAEQARLEAERIAKEEAERAEREEAERQARIAEAAKAASSSLNENLAMASFGSGNINGIDLSYPLNTTPLITSRFGESSSRRYSAHTGVDLATSLGTDIFPVAEGIVTFSGWQGSYGNLVIIDHGDGIQSWYGHCNSLNVSEGEEVSTDTCIAEVGSTGNSTGPHLHLEIRVNGTPVNPQNYIY